MLPEGLLWITEAFEPEGDPFVFLQIARDLEADGNLEGAATVHDRAYGLAPDVAKIRDARRALLDRLAVTDHGLRFRYIPAGPFLMGSRDGEPDEQPLHPVWLSAYWLCETPISWDDYARLMGWNEHHLPQHEEEDVFLLYEANEIRLQYCGSGRKGGRARHGGLGAGDRYDLKPMVAVGWEDAEEVAGRMNTPGYRFGLPTEAQWEKAARGGLIGARFSWGDDPPTPKNCDFNNFYDFTIQPMKTFPPNGYGLYAMCGGVWEWTADWYDAEFYRESPTHDPRGPASGKEKALRGGCWADCADVVTTTYRMSRQSRGWRGSPRAGWGGHLTPTVGFRLCRTRAPETTASTGG